MRVQGAEENLRVGGGLGQPEAARMAGGVLEAECKFDFDGDVLRRDQLQREAIEEAAEKKEERFERFDGILEFHRSGKCVRRRDGAERVHLATGGTPPEREAGGAEAADEVVAGQGREVAEGAQAPAGEDGGEFG